MNCSLHDILRQIASSFRWRDTARLTIGTVGAQVVTVATLPLLSRLYSPASFGIFAVVQSFAALFSLLSTLNLQGVTPTIPQATLATRFTSTLLSFGVICAVVLVVIGVLVLPFVPALNSPAMRPYAIWAVASGLTTTTFLTLRSYQIKLNMTKTVTIAQLARATVTVVTAVMFAAMPVLLGSNALGLIVSSCLGDLSAIIWILVRLPTRLRWQLAPVRPRRMFEDICRRRSILFGAAWSHSLNAIAGQAPLWIITLAFGPICAGWYALAYRVVSTPTSFVGATITGVLSSQLSVDYHRGKNIGRTVKLAVAALSVVGVAGYGLLAVGALLGTAVVFGQQWAGASTSLMILSIAGFMIFLSSATNFLPIMLGATRFLIVWSTVRTVAEVMIMMITWQLGSSYNAVILFYAIVESICYTVFIRYVIVASAHVGRQ